MWTVHNHVQQWTGCQNCAFFVKVRVNLVCTEDVGWVGLGWEFYGKFECNRDVLGVPKISNLGSEIISKTCCLLKISHILVILAISDHIGMNHFA